MRAYLGGDSGAFEALYRRHAGRLYGYLYKKVRSRESADEVFQGVFMKLHKSRAGYDFAYPFSQWLFVIARTALLDHFRKAGRQVAIDDGLDPDQLSRDSPSPALRDEKGLEALAGLPTDQRQAVEMRVMDELSYGEIAARLDRSQESVRQMVSRGLRKLRLIRGDS